MFSTATKATLIIGILLQLSACQDASRPQGHYTGTLYQPVDGILQARPVTFDIGYESNTNGTITIADLNAKMVTSFQFQIDNDGQIEMGSLKLSKDPDGSAQPDTTCYTEASEKLCYSADSFSLEIFNSGASAGSQETFGLFGRLGSATSQPVLEICDLYAERSPSGRASDEFRHPHRVRTCNSSQAFRQECLFELLPHLSSGSVLQAIGGGTIGIIQGLGDFAPFLFPSRWFQADQAAKRSLAEDDTLALMRADLLPQVEGLVYASLQDEASMGYYRQLIADATASYQTVLNLEAHQQMPAGSADHLLSSIQSLQMDEQGLELLVQKDHSAIAQALGLMNPDGVLEVSLGSEVSPVETAQALQAGGLIGTVLDRSLELHQIADFTQMAELQQEEIPYDWLDPAYDANRDLGFQLGAEVGIAQSKVQELETHFPSKCSRRLKQH